MSELTSPPALPAGGDDSVVLRLERVVRRFGGVTAVDDVSLELAGHERLAIIGPNGAGKTTLFRLIAGEMRPNAGRIHLFGRDVTRLPAHRRAQAGLARTFQVSNLFPSLSVADNVRLAVQAATRSRWRFWAPIRHDDEAGGATRELLSKVGLERRRADRVADLSHGEQRQLEVAMALAMRPRLLLLDEPAAGLAGAERAALRRLLDDLPDSLPIVLIEHDMALALGFAHKVLCLDNGRTVAFGPPSAIRDDPVVQAIYLGRRKTPDA